MRVLVVDSFGPAHAKSHLVSQTLTTLRKNGNKVDHLDISSPAFDDFMSPQEWAAYESASPLLCDATRESADRVKTAEALLFAYPTTLFGVCPRTKAWICLLYTSPSPRDATLSRMPSSA